MVMVLEKVVPFGRSLDEYVKMFNLTVTDLAGNILGVGDGPASFNAEGTNLGYKITSIDPIYTFTGQEIESRFYAVVDDIIDQIKVTANDWVWSYHHSPEELRANRVQVLNTFLQDYKVGQNAGRYLCGELPILPFSDDQFSLALCSHFLFLYSDHFDEEFHLNSVKEMLRVASEVRVFPLLTLMFQRSQHLNKIIHSVSNLGCSASIQKVPYELQPGGNEMLVIRRAF
ncbi:SAM-dependent methyltransferase [Leptolyngbya sp. FACHB-261]|uniref:SAM-dependent methyltransferase n=1 Tax=Leptolyngbya sp. FACHB-261 TaxID=2692806 RepID=UPI001688B6A8|nr:SAM-dependent methyltransferase [Leptolyngbya sp. FACHB-261]MBD2101682.1 SAM-dependent methyltransferase [Leptolyngbya sp. FACHB-261]